jgi:hypothetical protein
VRDVFKGFDMEFQSVSSHGVPYLDVTLFAPVGRC